jgi:hypothetical protein
MKIELAKECIAVEVPDLEKLIKQFDIRGHVAIFDDNRIYFVIDELKKKYYV